MIDKANGVQMDFDAKNRFTGLAFIAFKNAGDYELALRINLSSVSKWVNVQEHQPFKTNKMYLFFIIQKAY